jgi:adenylosuccinate synthase
MVQVIIGLQFGDEGKGRVLQFLAKDAEVVARYQGGENAGHTIWIGGKKLVCRLLPSGIIDPHVKCVIGSGVNIEPKVLLQEMQNLSPNIEDFKGRLFISKGAHLVMPYHKLKDDATGKIGTTRKGIGPCYEDKYGRRGIRVSYLLNPNLFKEKVAQNLPPHLGINLEDLVTDYLYFGKVLSPFMEDTAMLINQWIDEGYRVLLEGAQGGLLDIDHGTYPYVTSSHPHSGGACCGLGIGPTKIDKVIGVVKSYITRVGNGPLPTQMEERVEKFVQQKGSEYGATTGRLRRCGWFDVVLAKRVIVTNDVEEVILTKLDVLDGMDEIKICTQYQGGEGESYPENLGKITPVYKVLPGWKETTRGVRRFSKLPSQAKRYIERIMDLLSVKITTVCVGPSVEDTIFL